MQYIHNTTFGNRLFVLVGSAVGFTLLLSILASILSFLYGIDTNSAGGLIFLKVIQLVMTVVSFLVPALIFARLYNSNVFSYLKVNVTVSISVVVIVMLLTLFLQPLLNASSEWLTNWHLPASLSDLEHALKSMEQKNSAFIKQCLDVHTVGELTFNVFLVAVVPAIAEECFFRGGLQQLLAEKMTTHAAIWVTALIFSSVHFDVTGFIPRLLIGAFLGYLYVWTGSLWTSILAHFINNLFGLVMEFFIYNSLIDKGVQHIGTGASFWLSLTGIILFVPLSWMVYCKRNEQ